MWFLIMFLLQMNDVRDNSSGFYVGRIFLIIVYKNYVVCAMIDKDSFYISARTTMSLVDGTNFQKMSFTRFTRDGERR